MRKNKTEGAVPGAGRKPIYDEPTTRVMVRMPIRLKDLCQKKAEEAVKKVVKKNPKPKDL